MKKGYILLVVAALAAVGVYHYYDLGFITTAQAVTDFFVVVLIGALLIEALSVLKKSLKEALKS
ncbi:MAG: hypothetical protein WCL13_01445 [bacterium]